MTAPGAARQLLALDVGNTSVKCVLIDGERIEPALRVPTMPVPGLKDRLREALAASGVRIPPGARCVVSSVCPAAEPAVVNLCGRFGGRAEFFGRDLAVPLPTAVSAADKVGVDRLLLALAARHEAGAPCIVVSAGTAITVDLVDADGRFAGGAIAPGFGLCARALHESTALLPHIEPGQPQKVVGTDTASAITNGVYWSCAGGVLALAARYHEMPRCESAPLICTGTDAPLLLAALPDRGTFDVPDLIFQGMAQALAGC